MSAPERLSERELELLAAVRQILDIPYPASWQDRDRFEMALRDRVYVLLGVLQDPVAHTAASMLSSLETVAARPLGYEPAPDEASP